jgi:predicted metal-dependent phosphoesterase TrpH
MDWTERNRIDLHLHTNVSDGTDSPETLLSRVREAGIGLFSVTDHDAIKCGRVLPALLRAGDPRFLSGVEFSCRDEQGKYHILGYGYDPEAPAIREAVDAGHRLRMKKVAARLDFLKTEFGFVFPQAEIDGLLALDNPGKPHIGNLMVKYGYADTKEIAIRQYINRLRLRSDHLRPETAIRGILESGGVPVLAHPAYGDGDQLILGGEMDARVRRLLEMGLKGLECFYSGFPFKLRAEVLALAERYSLYVTCGSDYHGGNKLVELGDTGLRYEMGLPAGLERFLEEMESHESAAI